MIQEQPDYRRGYSTAETIAGYSRLWYTRSGVCSQAVVIKAIGSGFILCLPQGAIGEEELDQAVLEDYAGTLGPWVNTNIQAVGTSGKELKKTVPCLLIDMQPSEAEALASEPNAALNVLSFGTLRLQSIWPARVRLLEALEAFLNGEDVDDRLDGYHTGLSEHEVAREAAPSGSAPLGAGISDPDAGEVLHQLLQQSSSQAGVLSGMQRRLANLDSLEVRLRTLEQRPAPATQEPLPTPTGDSAPAWAPQLFAEGSRAELDTNQLQHLLQLAGRGPRRLGDLGSTSGGAGLAPSSGRLGATPKARATSLMLGGVPEEDDEQDDAEPEDAADTLTKLLAQQTKILTQLAAVSKKPKDPLHGLLSSSSSEEDPKLPGVKGMAARQLMIEQFAAHPDRVVLQVRSRLAAARRKDPADLEPRDMYLHFAETVPLGSFKTLTYFSFLLAEMWEAAERGQAAELASLLALGLVFAEQVANEQGHTRLGWLLTGRQDPPFSQVEQRRAPRPEVPHGLLADPRWIAANLAYLRDADLISERTNRSQQTTATPSGPAPPRDDPKGRGRGKRGQRKQDEAAEPSS